MRDADAGSEQFFQHRQTTFAGPENPYWIEWARLVLAKNFGAWDLGLGKLEVSLTSWQQTTFLL